MMIFKFGTMKSGKSLELIKTYINYEISNRDVLVLKPQIDNRDGNTITTRLGKSIDCMLLKEKDNPLKIFMNKKIDGIKIKAILVDEAQFLTINQIMSLTDIVDKYNIPVWCFGLKTTFKNELFPGTKCLLEVCDKIEEIKTICQFCENKASFNLLTKRKNNLLFGCSQGSDVQIGDEEYFQCCRKCYFKYVSGKITIPIYN